MTNTITANISKLYIIKMSKWLMLTMPIIFLFYKDNGLATQDLFILKAAYSVAIVILEIPSGYFGDRWGRKASMVIGSILGFVGFSLYCISTGFWGFLICELILGVGQSFISGSDSAMLYDTLLSCGREDDYTKVEGKIISVGNYAEAAAAPIGVALAALSLRTPFYAQALVAAAAVPAALTLIEPPRAGSVGGQTRQNITQIIRYCMTQNMPLKWNIIYSSVIGTATLTMAWFVQPYFVHLSVPLAMYALLIPLLNLSTGTVSMWAYCLDKYLGKKQTIVFITISIALGYILLGCFNAMWSLIFLLFFYLVRGLATPVLRNYINETTPSEIRATVLSIRSLVIRLSFVGLGPVLGWSADAAGLSVTLFGGGIVFLIAGGFTAQRLLVSLDQEKVL